MDLEEGILEIIGDGFKTTGEIRKALARHAPEGAKSISQTISRMTTEEKLIEVRLGTEVRVFNAELHGHIWDGMSDDDTDYEEPNPVYIPVHFPKWSGPVKKEVEDPNILWCVHHGSGQGLIVCIDAAVFEEPPPEGRVMYKTTSGHTLLYGV